MQVTRKIDSKITKYLFLDNNSMKKAIIYYSHPRPNQGIPWFGLGWLYLRQQRNRS